jgi:hypothetical protein
MLAASTARTLFRRRAVSRLMVTMTYVAALIATLPLLFILYQLLKQGASSVSWNFFTKMPKSVGETGGGMANAIAGTGILVLLASILGLPVGIGAGLYLAEQRGTRLATSVRFLSDVLNGLPSIVLGIFGWQVLVRPFKHYSALAGAIALAAMMIPLVTRATEEMIRLVPVSISLTVFVRSDGVLGRQVCRADDEVDAIHNSVVRILVTHMMEDGRTITPSLELLLVSRNLERVADLATNIGEDAVFLAEGKQIKHHAEEALSSS